LNQLILKANNLSSRLESFEKELQHNFERGFMSKKGIDQYDQCIDNARCTVKLIDEAISKSDSSRIDLNPVRDRLQAVRDELNEKLPNLQEQLEKEQETNLDDEHRVGPH